MATPSWQTGTVLSILEETWNTRRYFIRMNSSESFNFSAGQFVTLDLPIDEKPSRRWRSYSIANHPDGSNIIELVIVLLEGGRGSTFIFDKLKVGDELSIRGPQGIFTLPESVNQDLFLVCTGTGIAPFRSMINHIKEKNISTQNIFLLYGCRTQKDLLYYNEMVELQNQLQNFQYIPTLSREKWSGRSGYVHQIYEEICAANKAASNDALLSPASFFLCGWKMMIMDARSKLLQLGYDKASIKFELYG